MSLLLSAKTFLPRKSWRLWENVEIYGTAEQDTDDLLIQFMRFACWITKAKSNHSEYVILPPCYGYNCHTNATQCYIIRTPPFLFQHAGPHMTNQRDYEWDQTTTLKLGGWHGQFKCPVLMTHWSKWLSALSSLHESTSIAHWVNGNQSSPLQTMYKFNIINERIMKSNTAQHCSGLWYRTRVIHREKTSINHQ